MRNTNINRSQLNINVMPGFHGLWRLFRKTIGKGNDILVRMSFFHNRGHFIDKLYVKSSRGALLLHNFSTVRDTYNNFHSHSAPMQSIFSQARCPSI